jgi:glycosyltransferase involved in cell wall biosynthesis
MITTFYPPYNFGGDGIFVYRLANELAQRGHQVEVIHCIDSYRLLAPSKAPTPPLPRQEASEVYKNHPNVIVHGIRSPFGFLSPLATQQTGIPFFKSSPIQEVIKKGFDVIHYHNISLVGGPKILQYGQGIKLYTMHEYWLVCPTHILSRFNRMVCARPYCFLCTLIYKRPPQWWRYSGLLKKAVKHVDVFIALSQFSKDRHHQMGLDVPIVYLSGFVPPVEVATCPTSELPMGQVGEKPCFLFVGRLEKLKGIQTLIPIFRHCQKAQLVIAGAGSFEAKLRELAHGSGNIHFLGYLSEGQLRVLYRQAVALIVPSICFESFSLVILEAFRSQTPVIVRNLGGMPELIQESGGGFVYHTDEELRGVLDKLLADPSYRNMLGQRGYEAYQRSWTPETHLKEYFRLIQEVGATRGKKLDLDSIE